MDPAIMIALIVANTTVTLFNLTRLLQVDMPKRRPPIRVYTTHDPTYPSPEERARENRNLKMSYLKKTVEYLVTFLTPAITPVVSLGFAIMSDLEEAIFTLALSIFLTIVSVVYQKIRFTH